MVESWKVIAAAGLVVTALGFAGGCKAPSKAALYEPARLDGVGPTAHQFKAGDYYISEQLTDISFKRAKEDGVKTVVNLRPDEELPGMDEKKSIESLGLAYVHVPVTRKTLSDEKVEQFIDAMKKAEEPVLVHCATGNRAAGLWAVFLAMEKEVPGPEAVALAEKAGMRPGPVKEFVEDYLKRRGKIQEAPAKAPEPAAGEKSALPPPPAGPGTSDKLTGGGIPEGARPRAEKKAEERSAPAEPEKPAAEGEKAAEEAPAEETKKD